MPGTDGSLGNFKYTTPVARWWVPLKKKKGKPKTQASERRTRQDPGQGSLRVEAAGTRAMLSGPRVSLLQRFLSLNQDSSSQE